MQRGCNANIIMHAVRPEQEEDGRSRSQFAMVTMMMTRDLMIDSSIRLIHSMMGGGKDGVLTSGMPGKNEVDCARLSLDEFPLLAHDLLNS